MQNFIFKFGIVLVLIFVGLLAVCAFAFPRFFASSVAAINNGQQKSLASPTQNARPTNIEKGATDVPEAEFKARLAVIIQLVEDGNFEDLVKEGDEIEEVWRTDGGERYAKLILEVTNAFGYSRICDGHPEVGNLSVKYATGALERPDSYSLETEADLVGKLLYYPNVPSFKEDEALTLRNSSKLCLHLLARLERERDQSADPYLTPPFKQLEEPEEPRWSGVVNPMEKAKFEKEVAKYNERRKWLGEQYRLRNVAAELAEPLGTKFLANVYSRPPFSAEELKALLSDYPIAESLRKGILKARDDLATNGHP
jgi:hypothetical protein